MFRSNTAYSMVFRLLSVLTAAAAAAVLMFSFDGPAAASLVNKCAPANGGASNYTADFCPDNITALSNGLAQYALIFAVGGICVSAALWALGSKGQNPGQELTGKRGLVVCCSAAFAIGALVPMVNRLNDMKEDLLTENRTVATADPDFGGSATGAASGSGGGTAPAPAVDPDFGGSATGAGSGSTTGGGATGSPGGAATGGGSPVPAVDPDFGGSATGG